MRTYVVSKEYSIISAFIPHESTLRSNVRDCLRDNTFPMMESNYSQLIKESSQCYASGSKDVMDS
jgi:hypothetical protein